MREWDKWKKILNMPSARYAASSNRTEIVKKSGSESRNDNSGMG